MVTSLWYSHDPNFGSMSWFWRCKEYPCPSSPYLELWWGLGVPDWRLAEHQCPQSPDLALWRMLEVLDWGVGILILIWIWSLVCDTPMFKILCPYLDFKGGKIIYVLKSWFGALDDAECFWLGFGILIMICISLLVFDIQIIQILSIWFDSEGAKNNHVL